MNCIRHMLRHISGLGPGTVILLPLSVSAAANFNAPIDRPYTLLLDQPLILEREMARQIRSGRSMSASFPRPCVADFDSSHVCGNSPSGFTWADPAGGTALTITPALGYLFRHGNGSSHAFELGGEITGFRGPISIYLDARTYSELPEDPLQPSYDGEPVDRQAKDVSGVAAYTSFSRYRANIAYDLSWGRFTAGRDAVHWGPGLYGNLVFHRNAVPFNQVNFSTGTGPFRVYTLYGQLSIEENREFATAPKSRSVYAHRYEASLGPDWLAGISEQLILYEQEEPFAFLPMVPLFIFKGGSWERMNNGNLAFDLSWRASRRARIYGEFLIDDVQSPASIFDDNWANKWGADAGVQFTVPIGGWETGFIAEAASVEPWVYTHYLPASAQSANLGQPLGNPSGPGQRSLTTSAFAFSPRGLTLQTESIFRLKGTDSGSAISDVRPKGLISKAGFWKSAEGSVSFAARVSQVFRFGGLQAGIGWERGLWLNFRVFMSAKPRS